MKFHFVFLAMGLFGMGSLARGQETHFQTLSGYFQKGTTPTVDELAKRNQLGGYCFFPNADSDLEPVDALLFTVKFVAKDTGPLFPPENLGYGFSDKNTLPFLVVSRTGNDYVYKDTYYEVYMSGKPILSTPNGLYFKKTPEGSIVYECWVKKYQDYYIQLNGDGKGSVVSACYFYKDIKK